MPFKVPGMSARDIRSTWKGHPDLTKAVLKANEQGWRIVKEGKALSRILPLRKRGGLHHPGNATLRLKRS